MTATEATANKPVRFLDVLPVRGGKRQSLEWMPHDTPPDDGAALPQAGFVVLTSDRDRTAYAVTEYPVSWGRGFVLTKIGGKGTDKTRECYDVQCSNAPRDEKGEYDDKCDCRGAVTHGSCRHQDAVRTLLINRWL